MKILAFFTNNNVPTTGLNPTIRIRDLSDDSLVITDASMSESGDGHYKYEFIAYDPDKDYAIRCDGGGTLPAADRYKFSGNENYVDDIWETDLNSHSVSGSPAESQMRTEYHNVICIDTVNGKDRIEYPFGTAGYPVKSISDAKTLADSFGLKDFKLQGTLILSSGDFTGYNFYGASNVLNNIVVLAGATVTNSKFESLTLTGTAVGSNIYCFRCMISDLSNADGIFLDSAFANTITVAPSGAVLGKAMTLQSEPTIIDFAGYPGDFSVGAESGQIRVVNASRANTTVRYAAYAGTIQVDSTCISGSGEFIGSGQIVDESGPGFTVDSTGLIAIPTIAGAVWDVPLAQYNEPDSAGTALMNAVYDGKININTLTGITGTAYPAGTSKYPINNLDDAILIAADRNINQVLLETSITVGATHDISNLAIETIGIMGTTVTFSVGCSANNSVFRYANLEGELTNGDQILVENCSILNLENFTGIMNNVAFSQGSEVSIGNWATIIQGTAGGDPTNEVEIDIGLSNLNMSGWTGNLKLMGKIADNRTVVNCDSGNIIIGSTCVSGSIQLLGVGEYEDNSGPNCNVDVDAYISRTSIAESVWDEPLVNHANDETTGYALLQQSYGGEVYIDTVNGVPGQVYPAGIRQDAVNSLSDALTVAALYDLSTIHVLGSLTVSGGEDLSGFTLHSDRSLGNSVNLISYTSDFTYFNDLTVEGTLNGSTRFTYCVLGEITGLEGGIKNSLLTGDISFVKNGNNYMTDCDRFITTVDGYVNINIADSDFNMIRGRGNYNITNKTSTGVTTLDLNGVIKVDSTCVSGTIVVAGLTRIIDQSGPNCLVLNAALTNSTIADAVWSETVSGHTAEASFSGMLQRTVGLLHENIYIDNPVYDGDTNLTSARVRLYSDPASVGTANDVIGTYDITAPGDGAGKFTTWKQVKA